jgi:hypothetical protein
VSATTPSSPPPASGVRQCSADTSGTRLGWRGLAEEQRWWPTAIEDAVNSHEAVTGELALSCSDGSKCQVEFVVTSVRDEAGRVTDVIAEGRDITERKRWEEHQDLLTKELATGSRTPWRWSSRSSATRCVGRRRRLQRTSAAGFNRWPRRTTFCSRRAGPPTQRSCQPAACCGAGTRNDGGPDVTLSPKLATSLGLVLHELLTNATKYGALSVPQGVVDLRWDLAEDDGQRRVHLTWTERGGPPVTARNTRALAVPSSSAACRGAPWSGASSRRVWYARSTCRSRNLLRDRVLRLDLEAARARPSQ